MSTQHTQPVTPTFKALLQEIANGRYVGYHPSLVGAAVLWHAEAGGSITEVEKFKLEYFMALYNRPDSTEPEFS